MDGVELVLAQSYKNLEADQVTMPLGARLSTRGLTITTKLAEATLNNLALALNQSGGGSGANYINYEPPVDSSATQPSYKAIILDGWAPNSFRRRIIVRKVLSTDDVKTSYAKDDQTVMTVQFSVFYVSSVINPFKIVDQTA